MTPQHTPRPARQAILYLSPKLIVDILMLRWFVDKPDVRPFVAAGGLPDDARIVRCFFDDTSDAIGLVIESESFEEIQEGGTLPMLPPIRHGFEDNPLVILPGIQH